MTSTPTSILAFEKIGQGDETGTWWENYHIMLDVVEQAIAGQVSVSTTGGTTALTAVSYTTDQSRQGMIRVAFGQTLLSDVLVTASRFREYLVTNESSAGDFAVRFGYDLANSVSIPRGCACRVLVKSGGTVQQTSPFVTLSSGDVDSSSIPAITSAMLDSAVSTSISGAVSSAAAASTAASAAVTTANATAALVVAASATVAGIVELATDAETQTGTDTARAVTPANLTARTGTTARTGVLALATVAEGKTGTDTAKAVTAEVVRQSMPTRNYAEEATYLTLTTVIPVDDTKPQITEGTQILSATITPKQSTSRIRVRVHVPARISAGFGVVALFKDSTADALQVRSISVSGEQFPISFEFEHAPATTSEITYRVRAGPSTGSMYINGSNSARLFGGASLATLSVEEVLAQ